LSQEIVGSAPSYAVRLQANLAALELSVGNIEAAKTSLAAVRGLDAKIPKDQMPLLPFAVEAKVALLEGREDTAARVLDRTFAEADFETTPEDETEAHSLAFEVYDALGLAASALPHLKALKRLEDAERDVAASANLAITNAEFELSTKELTIEKLRTERLQADVDLIKAKRAQDRMFYGAIVVAAVSIICFLIWQTWQSGKTRRVTERFNKELEAVNLKLRRSNVDLEKANSAKTEFLATTSHEIRTPLNAVINLTADVLDRASFEEPDREKLSTALRSAEHLHEIVSDVLDVARFEGRRVNALLSDVAVPTIVNDVVNLWRPKAEAKGLAFDAKINLAPGAFHSDEKLIRQVLSNLISNAIKFTPHGRVELSASGGSATQPLVLSVSDSGIGIAKESRDIIFESFRQVDTGGTRSFQGTGLGLAICKQITDLLGGKIDLESEVGFGTTFTITIPMSERKIAELEPIPEATAPLDVDGALGGLRVLAAEDNAVNAMVIKTILKGKVETLTIVENGQLAVDAVSVGDFDMVLMDKQMPVMDGVEATKRIRALPGRKATIPIVAVTADAFAAAREELIAAGADDYLAKPVKPDDLKRAIAAAVRPEPATEDEGDAQENAAG
ncbi:MAG: ATP-binding protein, partial [Pseudomonadota bacterium]